MPKISPKTVNTVTEMSDIVSVISDYINLEKRGASWWGCCPFHNEKTPSFNVAPDKGMYYCFGCNKGGNVINFLMEIEKSSFIEAVQYLAKRFGVEIIYENGYSVNDTESKLKEDILELYEKVSNVFHYLLTQTETGKKTLLYLKSRNIDSQIIESFKLGYAPSDRKWLYKFLLAKNYSPQFLDKTGLFSKNYKDISFFSNRLIFPICNRHGKTIAFGGRILEGEGPKYLNSSDMIQYKKGETVFAFHNALNEIRKHKAVILCEGYMDVLAFFQAGIEYAVAPLGTALTIEQVKLLKSFANTFYLSFDSDNAGEEASYKAIKLCRSIGVNVRVLSINEGKDPAEILQKKGKEALKFILDSAIFDDDYLIQTAIKRFDISNPEGKAQSIAFLFPYIEIMESDIQRESIISKISSAFGISHKAILHDYANRGKKTSKPIIDEVEQKKMNIKMNAELRLVIAVIANPTLFSHLRSQLTCDDFEDFYAKHLFIVLEECYRDDTYNYSTIMLKSGEEKLNGIIAQSISKGEFAENAEKIVNDGINFIKQNTLQRQRNKIIGRLKLLNGEKNIDNLNLTKELMEEKQNIDIQLKLLKGKVHD